MAATSERWLEHMRAQTAFFASAYNLPVHRKLEEIGYSRLQPYLERFIRFKSETDRRVLDATRAPADGLSDEEPAGWQRTSSPSPTSTPFR